MRTLKDVTPTAEQLGILSKNALGVEIIRGAAGSGKTTTALLRLRSLVGVFLSRRRRESSDTPVKILVLTYNRTLRGYISELASHQVSTKGIELSVSTFGKWALSNHPGANIVDPREKARRIKGLAAKISLPYEDSFLLEEVEYAMGRFLPGQLDEYITARRDGRGASPRVERAQREKLLNDVIVPYQSSLEADRLTDWNDLAVYFAGIKCRTCYDIIVVDEAQDFSANQLRAVANQRAPESSVTFVLDTAQRIYARGYTWSEVGISVRPENVHRLSRNYRNTRQIAGLAASLMSGVPADDDATLPDFTMSDRDGRSPILLQGSYSKQIAYAIDYICNNVDLSNESVGFLKPLGGGWFSYLEGALADIGIDYVHLTKKSEWPKDGVNVGLSTLHSAKGLEFDHVIILGLSASVTPHGLADDDDKRLTLRRLLAMGVGRAKEGLLIGYKLGEASELLGYIDKSSCEEIVL